MLILESDLPRDKVNIGILFHYNIIQLAAGLGGFIEMRHCGN